MRASLPPSLPPSPFRVSLFPYRILPACCVCVWYVCVVVLCVLLPLCAADAAAAADELDQQQTS